MPPLTRKPPAKAPSKKGTKGARTSGYTAEEREQGEDLLGECEELIRSIAEARWPFYRPLREVLALVRAMPESQAFIDDPTKIIPGYAKAIAKPMWLKQMQQKIAAAEYGSVEEFAVDMRLVFDNCYQRNGLASLYSEQAKMLELRFEDLVIERLGYPAISDADVMAALSQNRAVAQTKIPPHIEFYQKELKKDGRLQFTPQVLRSATRRRVLAALGTPLPKPHAAAPSSSVPTTAKSAGANATPPPRPSPATTAPPAAAPPSLLSAAAKALHVAPATAPAKAPVKLPAPAAALAASSSGSLSKVPVPALLKTAVPPGVKMPAALPGSKIPAAAPAVRAASGTPPPTATATNPAANLDIAAAYQKREMPGHAFKQLEPSPLVRYGDESVKPHHHGGHGDDNGESSSGSDTTSSSGSSSDTSSSSNSGPASAVDSSSASADSAFARVMEDDDALHIGQPSAPLQQPAALNPPVANPPVPAPRATLPTTTNAAHHDVAAGKRARSPDSGTPTNVNGQRGANGHGAAPPMPQDDSSDDEAFAKVMASHADGFQSAGGIMPTSGSGVGGNGGSDEDSGDGLTLQHNRHDAKDFIAPDSVSPFGGMDHGFSASPADPDDDALLLGD